MLEFEWNEQKRIENIKKHKIDFVRAVLVFDGRPIFSYPSNKDETWYNRCLNIIRIILMRRARYEERKKYHEIFS